MDAYLKVLHSKRDEPFTWCLGNLLDREIMTTLNINPELDCFIE